jgi:hypothetical protein
MQIVYQNRTEHASPAVVDSQVSAWQDNGTTISDSVAQAIASYWHSPSSPNSTILSTMGAVTPDMSIEDFCSDSEYARIENIDNRWEVDALGDYIYTKQTKAGMALCEECAEMAFCDDDNLCEDCEE